MCHLQEAEQHSGDPTVPDSVDDGDKQTDWDYERKDALEKAGVYLGSWFWDEKNEDEDDDEEEDPKDTLSIEDIVGNSTNATNATNATVGANNLDFLEDVVRDPPPPGAPEREGKIGNWCLGICQP